MDQNQSDDGHLERSLSSAPEVQSTGQKRQYESPQVEDFGTVQDMTAGSMAGMFPEVPSVATYSASAM